MDNKWIDINDKLPPNNKLFPKEYLVSVIITPNRTPKTIRTTCMTWETKIVRNKFVKRWKQNGKLKLDYVEVTHWMELPKPFGCE